MNVIIRLQNLPWSANALDIRAFFRGLSIPDGGVHIVGGEMGDAFIAFGTDEDARQAMAMDRGKINEVQVRLLLSSRAEMQKVIEQARQNSLAMQMQRSQQQNSSTPQPVLLPTPQPPVITSTTLKHIMKQQTSTAKATEAVMQKFQTFKQESEFAAANKDRDDINLRKRSKSRERHRSRSRSRERRRSRSRERGNNNRNRRHRSRSRSRDRTGRRRTNRRSRDRSPDKNRRRDRNSRDSRDRDSDRSYMDKDFSKKPEMDSVVIGDDNDIEQPPIPPPNSSRWAQSNNAPPFGAMTGYSTMNQPNLNQMQGMNQMSPNINMGYQTQMQQQNILQQNLQQQNMQQTNFPQQNLSQTNLQQKSQIFGPYGQQQQQSPSGQNIDQTAGDPTGKEVNNPMMKAANMNYQFMNFFKGQENSNSNSKGPALQNPYAAFTSSSNPPQMSLNSDNKLNFSGMFNSKKDDSNDMYLDKGQQMTNQVHGQMNYSQMHMSQTQMGKDQNMSKMNQMQINQMSPVFQTKMGQVSQNNANIYSSNQNNYKRNISDFNSDDSKGTCVKVYNMDTHTSYSDVRRFFGGLFISNNGIKMINDNNGIRIGVCYIKFVKPESKPKAISRNSQQLKDKFVNVESVTDDEFEKAVDSFRPNRRFNDGSGSRSNNEDNRYGDRNDRFGDRNDRYGYRNDRNNDRGDRNDRYNDRNDRYGDRNDRFNDRNDRFSDRNDRYNERDDRYDDRNNDNGIRDQKSRDSPNKNTSNDSMEIIEDESNGSTTNNKADNMQMFGSKQTKADKIVQDDYTALLLKDIPPFAKEHDIMKLFSAFTLTDIILTPSPENRRQSICYVKFHRVEDAKAALENKSSHIIGHKQIIVSKCSDTQFLAVKAKMNDTELAGDGGGGNDDGGGNDGGGGAVVTVVGAGVSGGDSGGGDGGGNGDGEEETKDNKDNVEIQSENEGSNTEEGSNDQQQDVEVIDENNDSATVLSGDNINQNKSEIPSLLAMGEMEKPEFTQEDRNPNETSGGADKKKRFFILMRNCEYKLTLQDYQNFFMDVGVTFVRIEILKNRRNQPNGETIVELSCDEDMDKASRKNNTVLGQSRSVRMEEISIDDVAELINEDSWELPFNSQKNFGSNNFGGNNYGNNNNRQNNFRRGGGNSNSNSNDFGGRRRDDMRRDNMNMQTNSSLPNTQINLFGTPGCVLGLGNVPYKANTEDILQYFGNFNIGPENVIRRYNDDGTPTGDARIAFNSPNEARAAMQQKNKGKIFGRTLHLSLV